MIVLERVGKWEPHLREMMAVHYSQPKGFVGRSLIYLVKWNDLLFGAIAAGSATKHLPGRAAFFGVLPPLNNLVNNTFFHVVGDYPCRNFTQKVIAAWRERVVVDWPAQYGDAVQGWETLVELPRTGECYRRDGWTLVGQTKGYTCKRTAGTGTDAWSGKRVWDTKNLRPKHVFVRKVT